MDKIMALAVSVGVLMVVLIRVASIFSLNAPIAIIAWACFFASGGKMQGLQKTVVALLSGVIWVLLANLLVGRGSLWHFDWIFVGVVAFVVVIQSKLPLLSFMPAALLGAGVARASGVAAVPDALLVTVALVAGAVLGFVSEWLGGKLTKKA